MKDLLQNPVFNALLSGDRHLSFGTGNVKYFDEEVSPFAGFDEKNKNGFSELFEQFPSGRKILFAIPSQIFQPVGWQLTYEIKGLQFVYDVGFEIVTEFSNILPLVENHVE